MLPACPGRALTRASGVPRSRPGGGPRGHGPAAVRASTRLGCPRSVRAAAATPGSRTSPRSSPSGSTPGSTCPPRRWPPLVPRESRPGHRGWPSHLRGLGRRGRGVTTVLERRARRHRRRATRPRPPRRCLAVGRAGGRGRLRRHGIGCAPRSASGEPPPTARPLPSPDPRLDAAAVRPAAGRAGGRAARRAAARPALRLRRRAVLAAADCSSPPRLVVVAVAARRAGRPGRTDGGPGDPAIVACCPAVLLWPDRGAFGSRHRGRRPPDRVRPPSTRPPRRWGWLLPPCAAGWGGRGARGRRRGRPGPAGRELAVVAAAHRWGRRPTRRGPTSGRAGRPRGGLARRALRRGRPGRPVEAAASRMRARSRAGSRPGAPGRRTAGATARGVLPPGLRGHHGRTGGPPPARRAGAVNAPAVPCATGVAGRSSTGRSSTPPVVHRFEAALAPAAVPTRVAQGARAAPGNCRGGHHDGEVGQQAPGGQAAVQGSVRRG